MLAARAGFEPAMPFGPRLTIAWVYQFPHRAICWSGATLKIAQARRELRVVLPDPVGREPNTCCVPNRPSPDEPEAFIIQRCLQGDGSNHRRAPTSPRSENLVEKEQEFIMQIDAYALWFI
jgi:hypothetical protein